MEAVLFSRIKEATDKGIDYVITSHGEQDHSGSIPRVLDEYPQAKVICTPKCKSLIMHLLHVSEARIVTVENSETLSLGDKTLEFIHAPWVHWPETMFTFAKEDGVLFPCDLFGSHIATNDLYVTNEHEVFEPAKRYFAEIMMPFRSNIQRHLERLESYAIKLIAPSHGPLYNKPSFIMNAYRSWVFDPPENIVVLPYVSMHGSTYQMVTHLVEALTNRGIIVKQFQLSNTDIGKLAMSLVDAATLVLATPTVLTGPHPLAAYAAFLANALRPKLRFATIIGSYGWGGRAKEEIIKIIPNLKVELLEPVIIRGLPTQDDFQALDQLADAIHSKHQELKINA
jgi:flavorubredoxin